MNFINTYNKQTDYLAGTMCSERALQFMMEQCNMTMDDVQEAMKKKERETILAKHKYSISQGSDGRWRTTLPDKTKKSGRRLVAKTNKDDLLNEVIAFYTAEEDEKYISAADPTLADLYPEWIVYRNSLTKSSSTIKRYKSVWNTWYKDKEISKIHISDLTYLYLNQWANTMVKDNNLDRKQYSLNTSVAKQILEYAVDKGCISENPFNKVRVNHKMFTHKKKSSSEEQVFSISEQKLVAEAAKQKYESRPWCITPLIVLLNFQLGLRIGELVALKWEDIDGNTISINKMEATTFKVTDSGDVESDGFKVVPYVKSEAGFRKVFLNNVALSLLDKIRKIHLKNGYYDDGYIFIASRNKKRGTSRTLTKYLESLCEAAGVMNKSSHKIRKTYISSLFDKGVNFNTIRELAGHEDEKTTLNNYCFDQKDLAERNQQLEEAANKLMAI